MNIKIYGTTTCVYCKAAQRLLDERNIEYKYYDLNEMAPLSAQALIERAAMRTVPIIYVDEELLGGYDALEGWLKGQKL